MAVVQRLESQTEYDIVEAVACVTDGQTSSDLNCQAAPRPMIREKGWVMTSTGARGHQVRAGC